MKRMSITLSALLAAGFAAPALADDGDWTGPYVGVSGGYTAAKSDSSVALSGSWSTEAQSLRDFVTSSWAAKQSVDQVNYGAQLGYNAQVGGSFVVGLEAEISGLSGSDKVTRGPLAYPAAPSLAYTISNSVDPKVFYGARAKAGIASNNTLFYVTGGWAWTNTDVGTEIVSNGGYHKSAALSHTFNGWTAGAGIEQKFGSNLSARLDYAYSDQGDFSYPTAYVTGSTFNNPTATPPVVYNETITQDLRLHMIRVGLNYHF